MGIITVYSGPKVLMKSVGTARLLSRQDFDRFAGATCRIFRILISLAWSWSEILL